MSDEVEVKVTKNGPYTIKGPLVLRGTEGEQWQDLPEDKPVALCRCGQSRSKPFCDGTHSKQDFESNPSADTDPYPF